MGKQVRVLARLEASTCATPQRGLAVCVRMRGREGAASGAAGLPAPVLPGANGVSEVTRCWHRLSLGAGVSPMNPSATFFVRRQVSAAAPGDRGNRATVSSARQKLGPSDEARAPGIAVER